MSANENIEYACEDKIATITLNRPQKLNAFDDDMVRSLMAVLHRFDMDDEAHTAIMKRNFDVRWTDSENYDVVLNTERVSVKECVDRVLGLVRSSEFAETDASKKKLQDLALAWRVKAALRLSPKTRGLRISVTAKDGRISLAGMLDTAEERAAVTEVAAQAGARDIDDALRSADAVRPRFQ